MRQYQLLDILIEFKYVKLGQVGISGAEAQKLSAAELRALPDAQKQLAEARAQLENHRPVLEAKYGESLRSRVAIHLIHNPLPGSFSFDRHIVHFHPLPARGIQPAIAKPPPRCYNGVLIVEPHDEAQWATWRCSTVKN